ncbi:MAG: ABC transporter ATP-binding protein [Mycoplasmataceae bacterium]|jgi:ABC-2 type transport system ATP-binding protein|nr:ABC transporter ATP-binding protein [Mycoplasmataceae bacterium]
MSDALKISNLNLQIRRKNILNDINFSIPKGAVCAFIGPNGAGKTTTIKSIMGLYKHKGEIYINDHLVVNQYDLLEVGYVPEKENFPKIKVKHFLKYLTQLYGVSKKGFEKQMKFYSSLLQSENLENRKLNILSSGQKKKILIIQALLHNPNLVIMDEPTENMDPDARQIFYNKVIKHLLKNNKTIIISTHQLDEIKKLATFAIFIKDGSVQYSGPVKSGSDLYKMYNKLNKTKTSPSLKD